MRAAEILALGYFFLIAAAALALFRRRDGASRVGLVRDRLEDGTV